jgi:methylated-DNA-[protein]-cysteine S-methyltransferase
MSIRPETGIYARESAALDRYVQVGMASGRVLSVDFLDAPDDDADDDLPLLDRIDASLEGEREDFAGVDVAMTMPTDRRDILQAVRGVPYGDQLSVAELAGMTPGLEGDDGDRQLVRTALAENPAPLVIPDHRVQDGPSAAPPAVEQRLRSVEGF